MSYIRNVYDALENYTAGSYVDYSGSQYFALTDSVGSQPDISPADWELIGVIRDANVMLEEFRANAIRKAFTNIDTFRGARQRPSAIQSNVMYQGNGGLKNEDGSWNHATKKGFHGAMIQPQTLNHSIKISKVALQFSEPVADLPLYLYNESSNEFLSTVTVQYTKTNSVQWVDAEFIIKGFGVDVSPKSQWYIGYFASDLGTAEIIQNDWASVSGGWCQSCDYGRASASIQKSTCKYYRAESITFDASDIDGLSLPSRYPSEIGNMAINLELTIYQDPTRTYINQSNMFRDLVKLAGAVDLLESMVNSTNLNRAANLTKDLILRALHGYKDEGIKGLKAEYMEKLEEICNSMENLDEFKTSRVVLRQRF